MVKDMRSKITMDCVDAALNCYLIDERGDGHEGGWTREGRGGEGLGG